MNMALVADMALNLQHSLQHSLRKLKTLVSALVEKAAMGAAGENTSNDLYTIMKAARILRQQFLEFERSKGSQFGGSLIPSVEDVAPSLYMFCKMLLTGKNDEILTEKRQHPIDVTALSQSLSISYARL